MWDYLELFLQLVLKSLNKRQWNLSKIQHWLVDLQLCKNPVNHSMPGDFRLEGILSIIRCLVISTLKESCQSFDAWCYQLFNGFINHLMPCTFHHVMPPSSGGYSNQKDDFTSSQKAVYRSRQSQVGDKSELTFPPEYLVEMLIILTIFLQGSSHLQCLLYIIQLLF